MSLEPDPRLRSVIAKKGIDRTVPDAGIGPDDVYRAWCDGHATAGDAIARIRRLLAERHDESGWVERIEAGDRDR